jgi:uncharacterized repeat protein (TIGR03803 family)
MPRAELVEGKDGCFYGTTFHGGKNGFASGYGTIFRMTPAGSLTVLATFDGVNGASPCSKLCQGKDGDFYGTTVEGGKYNKGGIFKFTPPPIMANKTATNGVTKRHPLENQYRSSFTLLTCPVP